MATRQIPHRSQPRTGHNPELHNHSDNSSGGRIHARDIIDLSGTGSSLMDHGLLQGLADDDHAQYLLLAGRTTGQLAYGGTASAADLTLSSTAHATKGHIYLGSAAGSAFEEALNALGLGTATPDAGLHVRANPQTTTSTLTPNGEGSPFEWTGAATDIDEAVSDGDTTFVFTEQGGLLTRASRFTLDGTVSSSLTTWTVTVNARVTGGTTAGTTFQVEIVRADGQAYVTPTQDVQSLWTNSYQAFTFTSWSAGSSGQTANSIKITLSTPTGATTTQYRVTRISVSQETSGDLLAVTIFDQTASTSLPFSLWRNSSGTTLASVSSSGAGQFQNVLLEDPGAGTGTVTLKAPTGVSSWSMTFPSDDGAANEVLITDGSGNTDWVTLASLLDDDLDEIGSLTGTGLLARVADNDWELRTLAAPAAGLTITNPGGVAGNPTFALANDLAALESLSTVGIPVRTTTDTWAITTMAQGDVFYASSTSALTALAKDTNATRYLSNTGSSNNPAWAQVNLANGVTGDLPFANLTQIAGLSVLGVTGNSTADVAAITAGTDHQVLRRSGTALAFGAVNLAQSAAVTGTLPVGNGGTGVTSFTEGRVLFGGSGGTSLGSDASLFWNDASNFLGVNETTPAYHLHVNAAGSTSANNTITGSAAFIGNTSSAYGLYVRVRGNSAGISGSTFATQIIQKGGNALEIYGDQTLTLGGDNTACMAIDGSGNTSHVDLTCSTNVNLHQTTSSSIGVVTQLSTRMFHTYTPQSVIDDLGAAVALNTFIGSGAGNFTITDPDGEQGYGNVGIGGSALSALTFGSLNMAIGASALLSCTEGANNVAIGSVAGRNITSGGSNVGVGSEAFGTITTGSHNIGIGFGAGSLLTGAAGSNVALGSGAGGIGALSNCIYIGKSAGSATTASNLLVVDSLSNTADGGAIIYGVMAASGATQTLQLNAAVSIKESLNAVCFEDSPLAFNDDMIFAS